MVLAPLHPASFPKRERVRRRRDYLAVQGGGRKFASSHFLLLVANIATDEVLASPGVARTAAEGPVTGATAVTPSAPRRPPSRLGYTVSKKVGGAVQRNRVKRLLREVFRRHKDWFPAGRMLVFIARPGSAELGYLELEREVEKLCRTHRARL